MPGRTMNARKRRVFDSVFGGLNLSQPTPVATPATGFTAPGQAFGVLPAPSSVNYGGSLDSEDDSTLGAPDYIQDQIVWDRAWHTVTHTLVIPDFPENRGVLEPLKPERQNVKRDFYDALAALLYPEQHVPLARQTEDVVVWHTTQVRHHFLHQVLPRILRLKVSNRPDMVLMKGIKILETAHRQYLHGLSFIKEQIDISAPDTSAPLVAKFRRDLHAIVTNSVMEPLSDVMAQVLSRHVSVILGLPSNRDSISTSIMPENAESERARRELLALVESFKNVGLTGERFQVSFAEIMNDSMTEYVYRGCKGVWTEQQLPDSQKLLQKHAVEDNSKLPRTAHQASPSHCTTQLCEWIESRFAKLTVQVLGLLDNKASVSWADKEKYKEMSIGRLAELRINELFDIVGNWPLSNGALDDLRTAITTPQERLHLTEVFAEILGERLLHPGASTLEILRAYISMIWSFHSLDNSKVLLDRVAYPLQLYLCSREDSVRIVIAGLLSDTEDAHGNPVSTAGDKLVELAQLLNNDSTQIGQRANDEELDWHDMEWVPDPVDAGPGYKRTKNADIIGTLISVLGSQESFIKEFQSIIAENLLRHDGGFESVIKVLELLKVRFGEAPLQACEVMLRDIQDSGRVNTAIRNYQQLCPDGREYEAAHPSFLPNEFPMGRNPEGLFKPSLHAKILSRLFWPQLHDESYKVPDEIQRLQSKYAAGFEELKLSRKLTWLPALGQATVEIELEDRTIYEDCHTWQATVIYAFQSANGAEVTVEALEQHLEMDETLIRRALQFWVQKLVLQETSHNTYVVLETLNKQEMEQASKAAASSFSAGAAGGGDGEGGMAGPEGIKEDNMAVYWNFVQGMLTNASAQMPLGQIAMMLNMMLPDGFPYSNEELQEFLGKKIEGGELEMAGGKYRLKK